MKKSTFITGLALSMLTLSLVAGCAAVPGQQQQPQKPAEEVIKDGMKKLTEATSYSYELAMKGDIKDDMSGDVKFDVKLNGALDVKDPKDPKVTIKLDGSATGEGQNGSGSFDVRLGKEAVYFNLMKLDVGEELPADLKTYMSKWWKITIPEGSLDELSTTLPQGEDADLTPEQKEMKQLVEDTKFFSNPVFVNMESVKGEQSSHYTVTLDKKALVEFTKKAAAIQGETIPAADLAEMEDVLTKLDFKGDVWVGATSGVMNQVSLDMVGNDGSGNISFKLTLGDVNKPVTLDAPAAAEEFPVEQALAPLMMLMGGGMPTGTMPTGTMPTGTVDMSGMGDLQMELESMTPEERAMMEEIMGSGAIEAVGDVGIEAEGNVMIETQ